MSKKVLTLFLFLIPPLLTLIYFFNLNHNSFYFLHDEFLPLSSSETTSMFFSRVPINLGSANTISMLVTFFDRLYYASLPGLSIKLVEIILYLLKFYLLLFLSFFGFSKIHSLYKKEEISYTYLFLVTLFYCFNTFTLIYFHSNAFSLTLLICYALAPLTFYLFHISVFSLNLQKKYIRIVTALLLFIMSFALYLFAAFVLLLFFYTILYLIFFKHKVIPVLKNIFQIMIWYVPLSAIHFLIPYDMFFVVSNTVNLGGGETYGNIKGGFLYQLFMWYSWGIYTHWLPRNIFTFYKYFYSPYYLISAYLVNIVIFFALLKAKKEKLLLILTILLLTFLFLIKGGQEPLGIVYDYFVNHFPPFRVFRSPDTKFSFPLIFIMTTILLLYAKSLNKRIISMILVVIILSQGLLIFNGTAIRGENSKNSSERIVEYAADEEGIINYLNKNSSPYSYVFPVPSVEFGIYERENNKQYIGPDLIAKKSLLPFLYLSNSSGILSSTYNNLIQKISNNDLSFLKIFPIRYFLIRHDTKEDVMSRRLMQNLSPALPVVFSNKTYIVLENKNYPSLITSNNSLFEIISPVKYKIIVKNVKSTQFLTLNNNYNPNWKLYLEPINYICVADVSIKSKSLCKKPENINIFDYRYLFTPTIFENSHKLVANYANQWAIDPGFIKSNYNKKYYKENPDGSIDVVLTLFYREQAIFYLAALISLFTLLISLLALCKHIKNEK